MTLKDPGGVNGAVQRLPVALKGATIIWMDPSLGRALGEAPGEGDNMRLDICHGLRIQTISGFFSYIYRLIFECSVSSTAGHRRVQPSSVLQAWF